jgi:predicted nuclease with TOPRIM domain
MAMLDQRMNELTRERDRLHALNDATGTEVTTLRARLTEKERQARDEITRLESRIQELETMQTSLKGVLVYVGEP